MRILQFSIIGKVIESKSNKPLSNLKIEAWDKDIKYNDLLGQTFTDSEGQFDISFDSTYFREFSPDEKPDLLFKVFLGKRLLKIENDKIHKNASEKTEVILQIILPEMRPEGKDMISMTKALEISQFFQKSDFKGLFGQVNKTGNAQFKFVSDMIKNSISNFDLTPIKADGDRRSQIVGVSVDSVSMQLQRQNIAVNEVKTYEPKMNRKSLSDLTKMPINLKPGQKIDLYEENGKVRFYSVVRETSEVRDNAPKNDTKLKNLQEELKSAQKMTIEKDGKIKKLELEMELLKKDHDEFRSFLKSDAVIKLMQQPVVKETPKVEKKPPGKLK